MSGNITRGLVAACQAWSGPPALAHVSAAFAQDIVCGRTFFKSPRP